MANKPLYKLNPKILFEDTHLVVLSKPAGLLSQGERTGDENLVDWLREYFGRNYVGLVHRLDRNTSGLMVVAKRSKSAERLTAALVAGKLDRRYKAVLFGNLKTGGLWQHHLLKDEKTNTVRVVDAGTKGAKAARLVVEPMIHRMYLGHDITLARFQLDTGRAHQIRVQCEAMGFPLIGDPKYDKGLPIPMRKFPRPALHSSEIVFPHPMTDEMMAFADDLPPDLEEILSE